MKESIEYEIKNGSLLPAEQTSRKIDVIIAAYRPEGWELNAIHKI